MARTAAAATDAEGAVRLYLLYLADPASLRDEAQIKKLETAAEKAKDPIDRLRALVELERARSVDGSTFRDDFVRQAKAWADSEGIPASAFRAAGVPEADLAAAGFDVGGRRRRAGGGRPASGETGTRQRAKAVPLEAVKDHVLSRSGPFTLAEVMEAAGGSPATVRKAVEELVGDGRVTKLGPAADHQGRGRAPTRYESAAS